MPNQKAKDALIKERRTHRWKGSPRKKQSKQASSLLLLLIVESRIVDSREELVHLLGNGFDNAAAVGRDASVLEPVPESIHVLFRIDRSDNAVNHGVGALESEELSKEHVGVRDRFRFVGGEILHSSWSDAWHFRQDASDGAVHKDVHRVLVDTRAVRVVSLFSLE